MAFHKAIKARAKLRAALFGPSGAGKTWTALAVGSGMGDKIALIDSERGSASKYADRFDFDTVDLEKKTVEEYVSLIKEAAKAGYEVLIIDSLTHAWQTLNEEVEKIADARYKGNFWAAWSEGTPLQRKLIDALISYPGHVIATMRSKTEWQTGGGEGNKSRPVRVGLAPEQGKGIEYEFDILFEITPEHLATIIKDRTGKFQDRIIEKPGREFGMDLVNWLNEGEDPPPPPADTSRQYHDAMVEIGAILKGVSDTGERLFTDDEINAVRGKLMVLSKSSPEDRLVFINRVLDEQKALRQKRVELYSGLAAGAPPEVEAPRPLAATGSNAVGVAPGVPTGTAQATTISTTKPPPAQTPPPATPPLPAMYQEEEPPEEDPAGAEDDDGFEDDIPGENDPPPLPPRAGLGKEWKPRPSLSEGFDEYLKNGKAAKPAAAKKGEEPDIF